VRDPLVRGSSVPETILRPLKQEIVPVALGWGMDDRDWGSCCGKGHVRIAQHRVVLPLRL